MTDDVETWSKVSSLALDYLNQGTPLFRNNFYSLWVRTSGTLSIAITKADPFADELPPVENDGGRITTFHVEIEHISEFINSYESLLEDEYSYKHWAYRKLTKDIIPGRDDA